MNILAIGAHFDDIELGCGGALAKHLAEGDNVYAFVATTSGFNSADNKIIRTNEVALYEGKRAMETLGVELICGNFNTLEVEFKEELNVKILKIVEQKKIDVVYTHWDRDIHHDHRAVALSSLHSCRHVHRLLMYRSNWYHSPGEFIQNFYVDISEYFDIKMRAVAAHESELERTHRKWISFFTNEAENAGQKIGVKYAEVFQLVKWLVG